LDNLVSWVWKYQADNANQIAEISAIVTANRQTITQANNLTKAANIRVSSLEEYKLWVETNLKGTIEALLYSTKIMLYLSNYVNKPYRIR